MGPEDEVLEVKINLKMANFWTQNDPKITPKSPKTGNPPTSRECHGPGKNQKSEKTVGVT